MFCGTLADWRAEYDSFTVDAVAMFHVLEHLDDPVEVLRECRSLLAKNGRLFIEVPNASSRTAQSLDRSWLGWQFGFHQWHYTPTGLHGLLGRAGVANTRSARNHWPLFMPSPLNGACLTPRICQLGEAHAQRRLPSASSPRDGAKAIY